MAKEAADKQQRHSMCSPPRPGLKCTSSSSLATSGMGGIAAELSPEQDAARNAVRQQQLEKMVKALVARVEKVIFICFIRVAVWVCLWCTNWFGFNINYLFSIESGGSEEERCIAG